MSRTAAAKLRPALRFAAQSAIVLVGGSLAAYLAATLVLSAIFGLRGS